MLVKVKERIDTQIYSKADTQSTLNSTRLTEFTATQNWKIILTAEQCVETHSKSGECYLDLYVNDTVVAQTGVSYLYAYYPDFWAESLEYYVNEWDVVKLLFRATNSSNGAYVKNVNMVQEVYNFTVVYHNLTPTQIEEIGNLLTCNLYGVFNNQYNGGLMVEKTNSAITWNITPGNFKWYIKVLFNGEYIKIPYYGN